MPDPTLADVLERAARKFCGVGPGVRVIIWTDAKKRNRAPSRNPMGTIRVGANWKPEAGR